MSRRQELMNRLKELESMKGQNSGFIPSRATSGGVTYINPQAAATQQAEAQQAKDLNKATGDEMKSKNLLEQSLLLYGRTAGDTKKRFGIPPGRISGAVSWVTGNLGINPYYKPFIGDKIETATAAAKLAAPSAKVGPEIISQFVKTLPVETSTFEEAREQVISSRSNALAEKMAREGLPVPLMNIRGQVEKEVDEFILSNPDVFEQISPKEYRPKFGQRRFGGTV